MRCPQCATDLDAKNQCGTCRGIFVGNAELDKMLAKSDSRRSPNDVRSMADWPVGTEGSERTCPQCSQPMFRITMERVLVERCEPHGVWFDRYELDRVLSPNRDEHDYEPDRKSQPSPEGFELGTLGTVVQLVYSQIRRPDGR